MHSVTGIFNQCRDRIMGVMCIGADSTGATGNFAPVGLLTQEPGQTLRFSPVPFMAVL